MQEADRRKLIYDIKNELQADTRLTTYTDDEIHGAAEICFQQKVAWAKENDSPLYLDLVSLNFRDKGRIVDEVFQSIRQLGVLSQIFDDTDITEVMINGYNQIFVERRGKVIPLESAFESKQELEIVIQKVVADAGREVSESTPIVDTRLADGSRVNVVMPPIALNGPIVTIRRFPKEPMTIQRLIDFGALEQEHSDFLENLVRAKYNIFVSGGTGSGKTTFLNALSNFIPSDERVITVEDSAELQIKNIHNLVQLETKNAGSNGQGEVTITDLIKTSLRMRPDRIVVGEVRGGEALDMLQAMNTGHDGSLSTGHANSPRGMLSRLESMILQGSDALPLDAIRQQISIGVDIIVHLSRLRDKSRKITEIVEVTEYDAVKQEIGLNPLYTFVEKGVSPDGAILGRLTPTKSQLIYTQKLLDAGIQPMR